jgi:2-(1,2-epoxy-1,2-dihydrophenyl)acetyl-CoA isomerase
MGLIWQCVDDDTFGDTVKALAHRLAAMPAKALADTRRAIDTSAQLSYPDALRLEADLQRELGRAHDYREGVAAFLDKRKPVFQDR